MKKFMVLELRVDFTVALEELVSGRIGLIYKAMGRWAKPCLHGKATVTFLVVTQETSAELQRRLEPAFEQMGSVDNHWCRVGPQVAVAKRGGDPFVHWLEAAWKKAGELNNPQNMRQSQVFRGVPERKVNHR